MVRDAVLLDVYRCCVHHLREFIHYVNILQLNRVLYSSMLLRKISYLVLWLGRKRRPSLSDAFFQICPAKYVQTHFLITHFTTKF